MRHLLRHGLVALALALIVGVSACGPTEGDDTALQGLSASRSARNIAVLIGARGDKVGDALAGPKKDVVEFRRVLENPVFGFEVLAIEESTREAAIAASRDAAARAGEDGTILWFFSGHGTEDGKFAAADTAWNAAGTAIDNALDFADVAAAMRAARATPVKRLIVMADACYSGNLVDGRGALGNGLTLADGAADGTDGRAPGERSRVRSEQTAGRVRDLMVQKDTASLYEQLLVFMSSTKTETSADFGADYGGAFAYTWRTAIYQYAASNLRVTLKTLVDEVVTGTVAASDNKQHPVFRVAPSESILEERLFLDAEPALANRLP